MLLVAKHVTTSFFFFSPPYRLVRFSFSCYASAVTWSYTGALGFWKGGSVLRRTVRRRGSAIRASACSGWLKQNRALLWWLFATNLGRDLLGGRAEVLGASFVGRIEAVPELVPLG